MKLRLLNGSHSALGLPRGWPRDARRSPRCCTPAGENGWSGRWPPRSAPPCPTSGRTRPKYTDDLVDRSATRHARSAAPIGSDGSLKIGERWLGALRTLRGPTTRPPRSWNWRWPAGSTPPAGRRRRTAIRHLGPRRGGPRRLLAERPPTRRRWSPPSFARSAPPTSPISPTSPRPSPHRLRPCGPGRSKSEVLPTRRPASATTGHGSTAMRQWHIQFTRHREGSTR